MASPVEAKWAPRQEPHLSPQFDGPFGRSCLEQAGGWSEQEAARALDTYAAYKDGLLLKVLRIFWALWRFGRQYDGEIPCVARYDLEARTTRISFTTRPYVQGRSSCPTRMREADSALGALRPVFAAAEREAEVLFPGAVTALPPKLVAALLAAIVNLYGNDRATTQHGTRVKAPGMFLEEFLRTYVSAQISDRFDAANRLAGFLTPADEVTVHFVEYAVNGSGPIGWATKAVRVTLGDSVIENVETLRTWCLATELPKVFAQVQDCVEEANASALLDGLRAKRRRVEKPADEILRNYEGLAKPSSARKIHENELRNWLVAFRSLLPNLGDSAAKVLWRRAVVILTSWRETTSSGIELDLGDLATINEFENLMKDPNAKCPDDGVLLALVSELTD